MITRRKAGALIGGAAFGAVTAAPALVRGQTLPVMRLGNGAGIIDSQVAFLTVGQSKRTPFYEEEGVRLEIVNLLSGGQTIQALVNNHVDTTSTVPLTFLGFYAKFPTIDVVNVYSWLRRPHWSVAVKQESPIKTLADLKGKSIGIRSQGDSGYLASRAMFREIGIDPDKDITWVGVNEGGPAGQAVYSGRVDAMALWDGAFERMAIAGFPLRHLLNTPGAAKLSAGTYAVRKSDFVQKRELYVRFFRAMAKSTVFADANPILAIKLHFETYPESKPKGKTDEEAIAEARRISIVRNPKMLPGDWDPDPRFGAMTKEDWEANRRFVGLEADVKDVTPLFTNDLIAEVNQFDREAIVQRARSMTL